MSKRKPPSQRPERKLDETAKAIARVREDAKPEKPTEPAALGSENRSRSGSHGNGITAQRAGGQAPSPSTKRPKKV